MLNNKFAVVIFSLSLRIKQLFDDLNYFSDTVPLTTHLANKATKTSPLVTQQATGQECLESRPEVDRRLLQLEVNTFNRFFLIFSKSLMMPPRSVGASHRTLYILPLKVQGCGGFHTAKGT